MNKFSTKIIAVILCVALSLTGIITVLALTQNNEAESEKPVSAAISIENHVEEITKDETVYVLAGADGSVKKIIVSDWIKNALGESSLTDATGLLDIENVKGDESYTISGDAKVWDAQGNDIYYQGNIEKELPVGLTVTYQLNGKPMSADEIVGKSGKVSIRFDYENRQYEMVSIDGKEEKIHVPFAMLTGMLLDNDHFRNVEVTNGKFINDGNRTAVVGIALPGLQNNLGIGKDKINIPDYVEITADVTDFSLGMTVTLATNELFNGLDTDKLSSIDGLTDSIGKLTDGMKQLLDGSSALYDGLYTLLDKSGELVQAIDLLAAGAKALEIGVISLDSGAGHLKADAKELSNELNALKNDSDDLIEKAKRGFVPLLSAAETQIKAIHPSIPELTIDNYAEVLNRVIASAVGTSVYDRILAQVTADIEKKQPLIVEMITDQFRKEMSAQIIEAVTGMSETDYEAAVSAGTISDGVQATVPAAIEMQMRNKSIQQAISDRIEMQKKQEIAEDMTSNEVWSKLADASKDAELVIQLKASLDSLVSYNAFYLELLSYTNGVASAADSAAALASDISELKNGTFALKAGMTVLYDGILQLKDGAPALIDGVSQLTDGAMQLSNGLKQFNEEGIQKIAKLVGGDLNNILTRLKATIDVSKNYRNFAGITDDMAGQTKFIYRTDEVKAK